MSFIDMQNLTINKSKIWNVNDICVWAMWQKLLVDDFKCVENTSQFRKDFLENYNEDSDAAYFIEVDVD